MNVTGEPPIHASVRWICFLPSTSRMEISCVPGARVGAASADFNLTTAGGHPVHVTETTLPFDVRFWPMISMDEAMAEPLASTSATVSKVLRMKSPVQCSHSAAQRGGFYWDFLSNRSGTLVNIERRHAAAHCAFSRATACQPISLRLKPLSHCTSAAKA